jgi:hypothetical protein
MAAVFFYIVYDRLYKHSLSIRNNKDKRNSFMIWIGAAWLGISLAITTFWAINVSSMFFKYIVLTLSIINGIIHGLLYVSSFTITPEKSNIFTHP